MLLVVNTGAVCHQPCQQRSRTWICCILQKPDAGMLCFIDHVIVMWHGACGDHTGPGSGVLCGEELEGSWSGEEQYCCKASCKGENINVIRNHQSLSKLYYISVALGIRLLQPMCASTGEWAMQYHCKEEQGLAKVAQNEDTLFPSHFTCELCIQNATMYLHHLHPFP